MEAHGIKYPMTWRASSTHPAWSAELNEAVHEIKHRNAMRIRLYRARKCGDEATVKLLEEELKLEEEVSRG